MNRCPPPRPRLSNAQKLIDAQAAIDQANASLAEAQTELQDAQAALDATARTPTCSPPAMPRRQKSTS